MRWLNKIMIYISLVAVIVSVYPPVTTEAAKHMPKNAAIANFKLEGMTYEEARDMLQKEVHLWENGGAVLTADPDVDVSIPRKAFQFDIDRTLEEMEQQTKQPWYLFFRKKQSAELPLNVTVDQEMADTAYWPEYIDREATLERAKKAAAYLDHESVELVYEKDGAAEKNPVAKIALIIPDELHVEIEEMAATLNGTSITPNKHLSLIESVLSEVQPSYSDEGANFFASAFYALSLKTNMDIIERHSQGSVPDYTEAGVEAAVSEASDHDLIVYNSDHYSYTIEAEIIDNQLQMVMSTVLKDRQIDYKVEYKKEIKPKTLYRYSYDLAPGTQVPIETGTSGSQVEVYRVELLDGEIEEETLITKDFYPPTPTVFLVSSQEEPEAEELVEESDEGRHSNGLYGEILDDDPNMNIGDTEHPDTGNKLDEDVEQLLSYILLQGILNMADQFICPEKIDEDGVCTEKSQWKDLIEANLDQDTTSENDEPEAELAEEK